MISEKIKQLSNFYVLLRSPISACHTEWYRISPKKRKVFKFYDYFFFSLSVFFCGGRSVVSQSDKTVVQL